MGGILKEAGRSKEQGTRTRTLTALQQQLTGGNEAQRERAQAALQTRLQSAFENAWNAAGAELAQSWQNFLGEDGVEVRRLTDARGPYLAVFQDGEQVDLDHGLVLSGTTSRPVVRFDPSSLDAQRTAAATAFAQQARTAIVAGVGGRASSPATLRTGMGEEFTGYLSASLTRSLGMAIPTGVNPATDIRRLPADQRVEFASVRLPGNHVPLAVRHSGTTLTYGWPNWVTVGTTEVEVSRVVPRKRGTRRRT